MVERDSPARVATSSIVMSTNGLDRVLHRPPRAGCDDGFGGELSSRCVRCAEVHGIPHWRFAQRWSPQSTEVSCQCRYEVRRPDLLVARFAITRRWMR